MQIMCDLKTTFWIGHRTLCAGGAPANVACALAQLGTQVCFIGNLGKDDFGNQMADLLASALVASASDAHTHNLSAFILWSASQVFS